MVSYAAIAIAVVAVVLSLVIPGPAGPQGIAGTNGANGQQGIQGPQGPAGAGTLMNSTMITPWVSGGLAISGCTNLMDVNLTVPSAGTIVVYSTVHLWIYHTSGTSDVYNAQIATTATDCADNNATRVGWIGTVPSAWPSASGINVDGTFVNAFAVASAGKYDYFLNVDMLSGANTNYVSEANLVLVFYPG